MKKMLVPLIFYVCANPYYKPGGSRKSRGTPQHKERAVEYGAHYNFAYLRSAIRRQLERE